MRIAGFPPTARSEPVSGQNRNAPSKDKADYFEMSLASTCAAHTLQRQSGLGNDDSASGEQGADEVDRSDAKPEVIATVMSLTHPLIATTRGKSPAATASHRGQPLKQDVLGATSGPINPDKQLSTAQSNSEAPRNGLLARSIRLTPAGGELEGVGLFTAERQAVNAKVTQQETHFVPQSGEHLTLSESDSGDTAPMTRGKGQQSSSRLAVPMGGEAKGSVTAQSEAVAPRATSASVSQATTIEDSSLRDSPTQQVLTAVRSALTDVPGKALPQSVVTVNINGKSQQGPLRVITLQLSPAALGMVEISMTYNGSILKVRLETELHHTAQVLKADRSELLRRISATGYAVDEFVISQASRLNDEGSSVSRPITADAGSRHADDWNSAWTQHSGQFADHGHKRHNRGNAGAEHVAPLDVPEVSSIQSEQHSIYFDYRINRRV